MERQQDVFDRLVAWATKYRYMRWFKPIYAKHKEFLLYALFGLGTIIISIRTYRMFTESLCFDLVISNSVSWIFATTFAFLTNRKWVFTKHPTGVGPFFMQMGSFFFGRFLTLLLEDAMLYYLVQTLGFPNMLIKYIAQVVVIATNYFISKVVVFRRRKSFK